MTRAMVDGRYIVNNPNLDLTNVAWADLQDALRILHIGKQIRHLGDKMGWGAEGDLDEDKRDDAVVLRINSELDRRTIKG